SNENAPLAEHAIAVPGPLCLAMVARAQNRQCAAWPGTTIDHVDIPLPPSIVAEAERHAKALEDGTQRSLVLRSGSPAEARAVAGEIAKSLDREAVYIGSPLVPLGLGPWLSVCHRIPVFGFELAPGERKPIPALPGYHGPQLATCGPEGTLESRGETIPSW